MDAQWAMNALAEGSLYLLMCLGFGLVYRTVGFFDFSFAALLCIAPYAFASWNRLFGGNIAIASFCCVLTTIVVAWIFETLIFAPLRRREVSPTAPLLASLGLLLVVQNCIAAVFGEQAILPVSGNPREGLAIVGSRITYPQVYTVGAALACAICIGSLIRYSKVGRCIRSVGDDHILARIVGVSESKVVLIVFGISAIMATVAGLSISIDVGMTPQMGFRPFLMAVVAVILAGSFRVGRLVISSFFVAAVQHFVGWQLGTKWQEAVIFAMFLVAVTIRSESRRWRSHLEA